MTVLTTIPLHQDPLGVDVAGLQGMQDSTIYNTLAALVGSNKPCLMLKKLKKLHTVNNHYKLDTTCDLYNLFSCWPYDSDQKWS